MSFRPLYVRRRVLSSSADQKIFLIHFSASNIVTALGTTIISQMVNPYNQNSYCWGWNKEDPVCSWMFLGFYPGGICEKAFWETWNFACLSSSKYFPKETSGTGKWKWWTFSNVTSSFGGFNLKTWNLANKIRGLINTIFLCKSKIDYKKKKDCSERELVLK